MDFQGVDKVRMRKGKWALRMVIYSLREKACPRFDRGRERSSVLPQALVCPATSSRTTLTPL